jgi:hypothetical protein
VLADPVMGRSTPTTGSLPHADSMEIAATARIICFTNCRGFTMGLQITQVITIGIIQGKTAYLTGFLLRLGTHRTEHLARTSHRVS